MEMATDNRGSLREALLETLNEILSAQGLALYTAEEKIKALEVTEEYGIFLAQFTIEPLMNFSIKQLSIVLLKQYVESHWSNQAPGFQAPEVPPHCKALIKEIIPNALDEPVSKIRSTAATTVAAIAHWDWPENWPQLFDRLVKNLSHGNYSSIHGSMKVLKEIADELSDNQLPEVAPIILSEMLRIFSEDLKYDASIRRCAIEIFSSCTCLITTISEYHKDIMRTLFIPILPSFFERFIIELQKPINFPDDTSLKSQIIKALSMIVKRCPKHIAPYMRQILPRIWQTLTLNSHVYINTVVNNPDDLDEYVESDSDILKIDNLVYSIIEFFDATLNCLKFQTSIKDAITELLYYCILFMQITEKHINLWTNDLGLFIDCDEEAPFSYTVRIAAQDFFMVLCNEFPSVCCNAIEEAITKHVEETQLAKAQNNPHWWKCLEASIYALGSIKNIILDDELPVKVDILGFINKIVIPELKINGPDFLLGRCLWFGSKFAAKLEPKMIETFLQATVAALQQLERPCVKACAIRAVYGFCFHLKNRNNTNLIIPILPMIMDNLIILVVQAPTEILFTVLETITIVISIDSKFSELYCFKVISIAIAIFLKHNSDPQLMTVIQDLFKQISQNERSQQLLHQRLVPTIVSIFNAPCDKIPTGMHPVALDILQTLVRYSRTPMSSLLIDNAFPAAIQCILRTDDNSVMQSGGELLRRYLSIAPDQVCTYQDNAGQTGLWFILQVVAQLLNPSSSENSATFIGRLVITLIKKAGTYLGENLDLLLKAVLSKMQRAEALVVIQSLVMVYIHLILTQLDAVLNFLSSVPGPTGESALNFVLIEWMSRQHLFYGSYERKISVAALCKLLEYGVSSNDERLNNITVNGEEIYAPENTGVRTRSQQSQPYQYTTIPLLIKVYKLIVNEFAYCMESELAEETNNLQDSEDEDDEWRNTTVSISNTSFIDNQSTADDYVDDEDEDLKDDPYYQLNLKDYLKEYLQTFSQQECFKIFYKHLNCQERKLISSIGINISSL